MGKETNPMATAGPIEGYLKVEPEVTVDGDTVTLDARGVYYRNLNAAVRAAFAEGAKTVKLRNVNGQRYIGNGVSGAGLRIEIDGVPGNDLAMFMDGPTVVVRGNAQDGVGNTMNAGTVYVHGDAGDVLGYGMRGGKVFVHGDVGYRVGIHMKAYENLVPIMCCGGKARDFFGEYMAGGVLVLLGHHTQFESQPLVGGFCGSGMHGGVILLRGEVEPWQVGKECGIFTAGEEDMKTLRPVVEEWCSEFGEDPSAVMSGQFTKLVPVSHRPYGKLYTNM
jgi:glutamate synthase domain-containing protein 3